MTGRSGAARQSPTGLDTVVDRVVRVAQEVVEKPGVVLIGGCSRSGKTWLANQICAGVKAAGFSCLVIGLDAWIVSLENRGPDSTVLQRYSCKEIIAAIRTGTSVPNWVLSGSAMLVLASVLVGHAQDGLEIVRDVHIGPGRERLIQARDRIKAVEAEVAVVASGLAPRQQRPTPRPADDAQGPQDALGLLLLFVAIDSAHLLASLAGQAQGTVHLSEPVIAVEYGYAVGLALGVQLQRIGQDGADFSREYR